ncbi:hypothetical protein GE061_009658 [Apolygus lucorum]|uniref:EGF-like domain-containing protein n=1 Tax=Apolygus lucorum TaxID=248454 RepID=A0A6A4KGA0_APOLU|nr:hypothetical protein GE061_009658 [Apolygus lucorum]
MFGQWTTTYLLVFCLLSAMNCGAAENSCFCGYGGVCRFNGDNPVPWDCTQCSYISYGLYEINCTHLVDHCIPNPCLNNGKCVTTFGSFFCECPPEYIGRYCRQRRTEEMKNFHAIVGPRVWFQVNRVYPEINQPVYFTFEDPGDDIQLQVRFDDGRFYEVRVTKFKVVNAKEECIQDVNENPRERDIRICETLLDKKVYSVKIDTRFFDDGFTIIPNKVEIESLGVVEGRVDSIHIAVMNEQIVTFAQEFPIHTSFELSPKCGFYISFKGCTRRKSLNIFHDKTKLIYLRALKEPIGNCSVGIVDKIEWDLPAYVLGTFNVGILHGATRSVPCISPLTMRLYSYNSNYPVNELASIWKCKTNKTDEEEEEKYKCRKQRFLGSKIFYRSFPCGTTVKFEALILHIPTGLKLTLTAEVETSIHIDTLNCRCSRNCHPNIDPRSKTKIWVDDVRFSTDERFVPIEWLAWMTKRRTPWEIGRFVVPETLGRAVEIEKGVLANLDDQALQDPLLFVRAKKGDLHCEMVLRVEVPFTVLQVHLIPDVYMKDVDDVRNQLIITNININFLNQPYTFIAREIISEGVIETIDTIKAGYNEFLYLKLELPTFVVAKNSLGLETSPSKLFVKHPKKYTIEQIEKMINQTKTIVAGGVSEVALTEVVYISRYVMVLPDPPLRLKYQLLRFLEEITPLTFAAATFSSVTSHIAKIITVINRLTVVSDMTKPPFNINITPWVPPSNFITTHEVIEWNQFRDLASNIILKVTQHFFNLVSEEGTTRHTKVIELLFQNLLRYSISRIWEPYWHKLVRSSIYLDVRYDRENAEMLENFEKCVNLLLRMSDYQAEGYKDYESFDSGTITFTYSIFPRNEISKVGFVIFNQYQRVGIRITPKDTLEEYSRNEYNTLYLGVYVEIPMRSEMTTRVHIAFFTHLTQEPIPATIEVHMRVQKPQEEDSDITHHRNHLIIDYVRNSSSRAQRKRDMALYRIEFSPDSDIIGDKEDRNINLHFKSDADIGFQIATDLPNYENVLRNSTHGQGNFSHSLVIDRNSAYLAVLPGNNVPPDAPKLFIMEAEEFACVLRPHTSVIAGTTNDKEICRIANEEYNTTDRAEVTCVCPGPGVVYTYQLTASLFKLLSDPGHIPDDERIERDNFMLFYFWILPLLLIVILLLSWRRDRRNDPREIIYVLEDSFPRETHPYVIGVFTGRNLSAGTESSVAFKVHGAESSSRVHILRNNSYKVLIWGQDDWFVFYTRNKLGKILHISLWHDFEGIFPNWYCHHIVLYDVESILWYVFPVRRWIRIAEGIEFCRTANIPALRFSPEVVNIVTFSLTKHYKRVLRNNNSLISVFIKDRRHIFSYLQKALLASMYLLSLLCSVIIVDEIWTRKHHDYRIVLKTLIAMIPAFLLLALVSCIFMRSYDMTKKTRKLDLRKVNEIKSTIMGHRHTMMLGNVRSGAVMAYMDRNRGFDLLSPSLNSSIQSSIRNISIAEKKPSFRNRIHSRYNENLKAPSSQIISPLSTGTSSLKTRSQSIATSIRKRSQSIAASSGKRSQSTATTAGKRSQSTAASSQRTGHQFLSTSRSPERRIDSGSPEKLQVGSSSPEKIRATSSLREARNSQRWTPGSIWMKKTTAQTWIPDASFRPLRFDHKLNYVRFGGEVYLIIGWILAGVVILASLLFFILRTVNYGNAVGEDVIWMILLAVALEMLVVEPVLLLATSCYSVYRTKQGNFECNILELSGLPPNRKEIYDHLKFMNLVTRPCYHPLKMGRLETLYREYTLYRHFKIFVYFVCTLIFFLIPFVVLEMQHDTYNIWRLESSTAAIMTEPVHNDNPDKPLAKVHEENGISNYLLSVYLPATSQAHWYNSKNMNFGKRELAWFMDRNSKLYGSTVIRLLKASNKTKLVVDPLFDQYYSEAYGQFDDEINKTASISDWHEITLDYNWGTPTEDQLTSNGFFGKSGLFYPQSIGEEIFIRDEKKHKALGIHKTVRDNTDVLTRAVIVEMNVIHPSFSQRILSPTFGITRIQILFENAAAGPFSGYIYSAYGYAPSVTNHLRYCYVALLSAASVSFGFYFIKKASQEGLAALRVFRYWMVAICATLAFISDVLLINDFFTNQVSVETAMSIDVNTHIKSGHVTAGYFADTFLGPFYLCLCILLADYLNECMGVLYGRYNVRFVLMEIVAFLIYLFCSKCSEVAMKLFNVLNFARISLIPINGEAGNCEGCKIVLYVYGYIWFATFAIFIACHTKGFEQLPKQHVFGYVSSFGVLKRCQRRKKKPSVVSDRRSVRTVISIKEGSVQQSVRSKQEEEEVPQPPFSNVAGRLRSKFKILE